MSVCRSELDANKVTSPDGTVRERDTYTRTCSCSCLCFHASKGEPTRCDDELLRSQRRKRLDSGSHMRGNKHVGCFHVIFHFDA